MSGDELLEALCRQTIQTPLTNVSEVAGMLRSAMDACSGRPEPADVAAVARIAVTLADGLSPAAYRARTADELTDRVDGERALRADVDQDETWERKMWDMLTLSTVPATLAVMSDSPSPKHWRLARVRLLGVAALGVVALDAISSDRPGTSRT